MAKIIEGIKPTRMELIALKRRRGIAQKGDKILSDKRDVLVSAFFERIKNREALRDSMLLTLEKAYESLIEAEMVIGEDRIRDIGEGMPRIGEIAVSESAIMGVEIPNIDTGSIEKPQLPNYNFTKTNSKLDDALVNVNKALVAIVKLAEIEGSVQRLAIEIERTRRRANMLEYVVIPNLEATIKWIEFQLEEREREDFLRRKRIKALLERRREES
ncbi:MAG TPA: V-type ATP synthase subunit D [Thermoplasmata archaeon]|nr:V-type ATP synthase subunit D [Thermoplasmata archaeon]